MEAVLKRVLDQLGTRAAMDLPLDARAVRLDRANAEVELVRDLRVRVPGRDAHQHPELEAPG
jgi:hypothetical protein